MTLPFWCTQQLSLLGRTRGDPETKWSMKTKLDRQMQCYRAGFKIMVKKG
ncbi:hypothetical protein [Bradyrhizobium sp. McL0615]